MRWTSWLCRTLMRGSDRRPEGRSDDGLGNLDDVARQERYRLLAVLEVDLELAYLAVLEADDLGPSRCRALLPAAGEDDRLLRGHAFLPVDVALGLDHATHVDDVLVGGHDQHIVAPHLDVLAGI